jgi:3-deoxy-D-manno-octulosonic-acid transferase
MLYRILWLLITPLTLAWSLQQMVSRQGGWTYLLHRWGFAKLTDCPPIAAWFHAASVGEIRLAMPLINAVLEHGVLVTCNTPEAYRLAIATWGNAAEVAYCPLDYRQSVKRFLAKFRPSVALIIETEIWPELYDQCHQRDIRIYIVNGRISNKTFQSALAKRWVYPMALRQVEGVWAREQSDADRFIAMGCPSDRVHAAGSIKMSRRVRVGIPHNPVPHRGFSLAISTHHGEEALITEVWRSVNKGDLLVLVPRHPARAQGVITALESQGLSVRRSSQCSELDTQIDVLVVDTVGEVDAYCAHASFVFVGGSMVDAGGHNVFEPASWGKAIIVGPYTQNFSAEMEYLSARDAITIVKTKEALLQSWTRLSHDIPHRHRCEASTREAYADLPDRISDYVALVEQAMKVRA